MIECLLLMRADIEMLKSAFGASLRVGPVAAIDPVKGYRIELGEGEDGPVLSPWYPHPETGKTSVPLKLRQMVGMINPTGDPRQGLLLRGGYSGDHGSPNADMEANVFEDAGVRLGIKDGVLHVTAQSHVMIEAPHVVVDADRVELGGEGGAPVARVGDLVNVGSGSSRGLWPIVSGSTVVFASD